MPKTSKTVLRLDGEVTEASATKLREAIEAAPANKRIELRIHSPGGHIFSGNVIYNALKAFASGVDVVIEGLAASMASVIAMAGESRLMAENGRFMIHNPWVSSTGDAAALRKDAALLDSLKEDLVTAYGSRTSLPRERLVELMDAETWLTASEAKDLGFITGVVGIAKASIPEAFLEGFLHVPSDLRLVPDADDEGVPSNVIDLQNSLRNLRTELEARTSERDDARASLAKTKTLLQALKRSNRLGRGLSYSRSAHRRTRRRSRPARQLAGRGADGFLSGQ